MKAILFDFVNVVYNPRERILNSDVLSLLVDIKEQCIPLYLFTNVSKESLDKYDEELHFKEYFVSFITNDIYLKPDIRAYEKLQDITGFKYGDMLLVDDNQQNINTCKELGMDGIVFSTAMNLREYIEERIK